MEGGYSAGIANLVSPSCGDGCCDPQHCCNGACGHGALNRWPTGVELTFLRADIHNNRAFRSPTDDDRNLNFDYDVEASPRLWFGYEQCDGLGWRITWWEFNHAPDRVFAQSESGEEILSLKFDDFEFSSATTTDNLLAASSLNLYTWDFEVTKHAA